MRLIGAVFVLASVSRLYSLDYDSLFKADARPPCEAIDFSPPIHKECKHSTCGQEQVGEGEIGTDTGWSTDWCGFLVSGWDLGWCRSNRDGRTTRATSCCKSERVVDFFKRQCAIQVRCYVPVMGDKNCRTQACGVETPGHPVKWKQCRNFDFGLNQDTFVQVWNASNADTRSALSVVLLMDENRAALPTALPSRVLEWLAQIDPGEQKRRSQLTQIKGHLEQDPAKFTISIFESIISG